MLPRLFAIALGFLALSDTAFGRIGNSGPNVFAPRPIDHSSEVKSGSHAGRARSLSKLSKLSKLDVIDREKIKHGIKPKLGGLEQLHGRFDYSWQDLKVPPFGDDKAKKKRGGKAKPRDKKGAGLRKLKTDQRRRLSEEDSEDVEVKDLSPGWITP